MTVASSLPISTTRSFRKHFTCPIPPQNESSRIHLRRFMIFRKTWKPMNSARPGRTSGCEPPTPKLQADSALGLWHLLRKAHLSQVLRRGIRHTLLQGFHLDLEQGHRGVSPSKTGGRMGMSDLEKYRKNHKAGMTSGFYNYIYMLYIY